VSYVDFSHMSSWVLPAQYFPLIFLWPVRFLRLVQSIMYDTLYMITTYHFTDRPLPLHTQNPCLIPRLFRLFPQQENTPSGNKFILSGLNIRGCQCWN